MDRPKTRHYRELDREPARRRWHLAVGALVMSALAVTACGSRAASPPVAHAAHATGSSSATVSQTRALLLAGRCLRQHGIPNLPDPTIASSGPAKGQAVLDKPALVAVPRSVLNQAMAACHNALDQAGLYGGPNQGPTPQQMQDLLAFARCVRSHGVANFPDPNNEGGFNLAGTGINSHDLSSAQLAVARTCLPAAHGTVQIPAQGTGTSNGGP
jgi:hypothetical protein